MGKAAKRERQKTNKALKDEEQAKKQSRDKTLKAVKTIALILIVPVVVIIAVIVNKATDPIVYTAKITVAIDGVKKLPNNGVIDIKLDNANSPKSVKHFVAFASNGLYDGLSWHRAVTDFVIQGGDPKGDGTGSLGTTIQAELPAKGYKQSDLAWAKGSDEAAGTAGSQFFVITGKSTASGVKALNQKAAQQDGTSQYQYGYIGRVLKGLDVAKEIEKLAPLEAGKKTGDGKPTKKAIIVKVIVYKNGVKVKEGDFVAPTTTSTSTTSTTAALPTP